MLGVVVLLLLLLLLLLFLEKGSIMDGSDLLLQLAGVGKTEIFVEMLKGSEKRLFLDHCLPSTSSPATVVATVSGIPGCGGGGCGVVCCVVGNWNCCS